MNARVLLLMLVTAVFMAAWDGDQDAMQAAVARRSQQNHQPVAASESTESQRRSLTHELTRPVLQTVSTSLERSAVGTLNSEDVPLPDEIASGTYQAVNQAGISVRLEVSKPQHTQPRDFYLVDAKNGERWYLIRIAE